MTVYSHWRTRIIQAFIIEVETSFDVHENVLGLFQVSLLCISYLCLHDGGQPVTHFMVIMFTFNIESRPLNLGQNNPTKEMHVLCRASWVSYLCLRFLRFFFPPATREEDWLGGGDWLWRRPLCLPSASSLLSEISAKDDNEEGWTLKLLSSHVKHVLLSGHGNTYAYTVYARE